MPLGGLSVHSSAHMYQFEGRVPLWVGITLLAFIALLGLFVCMMSLGGVSTQGVATQQGEQGLPLTNSTTKRSPLYRDPSHDSATYSVIDSLGGGNVATYKEAFVNYRCQNTIAYCVCLIERLEQSYSDSQISNVTNEDPQFINAVHECNARFEK